MSNGQDEPIIFPFYSEIKSNNPLELLYIDLWGPSPTVSKFNLKYFTTIVDCFTRYTWVFPLESKASFTNTFINFQKNIENQLDRKIKSIETNGGGEFSSLKFKNWLKDKGIMHRFSCPHTPQQNGIVERKHRHLVETTRCLFHQSGIQKSSFNFCISNK